MKYPKKIRQPKKAKKVTLARIREIVKEELSALDTPVAYTLSHEQENELRKEVERPMYFPPSPIRPVSPPPRVFARNLEVPQPALPDCHEIEEGEPNAASK